MGISFGSKELYNALIRLGFRIHTQGRHVKFYPPPPKKASAGTRPFQIIQMERKTYDPHSASRYISQIKRFGFSKKEIEAALQKKK